jgi:aspartate carbamoyltransferase catalytic subunit
MPDIIHMTRIQKVRVSGGLREDPWVIQAYCGRSGHAKPNMVVMRPPPRLDEIADSVDKTPHARYFRQVWYGLVRMSLVGLVLGALS